MSNLLKSVFFSMAPGDVRVIDSDEKVEQFIPNIFDEPKRDEFAAFEPEQFESIGMLPDGEAGFDDGLSVISMEDVVDQERQKLLMEMQEEQEKLLAEAREQAGRIIADANYQADQIKRSSMEEGTRLGLAEGRKQAEQELMRQREELEEEYNNRYAELEEEAKALEPAFADIVLALTKKLTGVVCENKKDVIIYLIDNALHNLGRAKQIILHVSRADMPVVSSHRAAFRELAGNVPEFDVMEDESLSEHQCIIETENRIVDCSLDAQLENLKEHIRLLL